MNGITKPSKTPNDPQCQFVDKCDFKEKQCLTIMGSSDFQTLLEKHISEANILGNTPILSTKLSNTINRYYVLTEEYNYFFNKPYNHVFINTNDQDFINDITIYVDGIIDRSFYDTFINHYGLPNSIQIIDTIKPISKGVGDFNENLEKRFISTKEGSFEDRPLYMLWNKNNYQIKILLNHRTNKTEITFRLPTNTF